LDTVIVSGDCPELGKWDLGKAVKLEYVNANTWFGEIAGESIAYKSSCFAQKARLAGKIAPPGAALLRNNVSRNGAMSGRNN